MRRLFTPTEVPRTKDNGEMEFPPKSALYKV